MDFQFKTILVPVDFSVNTTVAIDKALWLSEGNNCSIHLFYVHRRSWPLLPVKGKQKADELDLIAKLELLKKEINERRPEIAVTTWLAWDKNLERAIARKANLLKASLIIIGKHSQHSWFPIFNSVVPSRLAETTDIPVLTVKPGAMESHTKTVIVPVSSEIDARKIAIMEALCRKSRIHIHLVAFLDTTTRSIDNQAGSFLNTFDWVKRNLHCPTKYAFVYGENKAKALLKYCRSVNADLLLVNPRSDTRIGWMNKHISDVLPAQSKTQVLSVQSYNF
jgi:nucleotide-binding universal stress UspA family protein